LKIKRRTRHKGRIKTFDLILVVSLALFVGAPVGAGFFLWLSLKRKYVRLFYANIIPTVVLSMMLIYLRTFDNLTILDFYIYNGIVVFLMIVYNIVVYKWKLE
jgi:hypothetical protein